MCADIVASLGKLRFQDAGLLGNLIARTGRKVGEMDAEHLSKLVRSQGRPPGASASPLCLPSTAVWLSGIISTSRLLAYIFSLSRSRSTWSHPAVASPMSSAQVHGICMWGNGDMRGEGMPAIGIALWRTIWRHC